MARQNYYTLVMHTIKFDVLTKRWVKECSHKSGDIITDTQGNRYLVMSNGSVRRYMGAMGA